MGEFILIIFVLAIVGGIGYAIYNEIQKKEHGKLLASDERMQNAKVFNKHINTAIAISENGYIGVIDPKTKQPRIIHIKDINGFEIIVDGQNVVNMGGAVVGGLLFGGVGALLGGGAHKQKIKKMNLLFKVNDFSNPTIDLPLLSVEVKKGGMIYNAIQNELQELMATLEFVEKNCKKKK